MQSDVVHAVIRPDEDAFTAECVEIAVVTQGDTIDELIQNLHEAIALHLEGENLAELGFSAYPQLHLTWGSPYGLSNT